MTNPLSVPTAGELEILKILWENDSCTVRFVNDKLNEKKPTGYTTTLKIMQIMHEKGFVRRNEENRTHIYSTVIHEKDTQDQLLDRLLVLAFNGSASKLVMQALGNHETSDDELEKIKKLIKELERKRKGK